MAVKQPQPGTSSGTGFPPRWTRLAAFVAPHLQPTEQVQAILTKTGKPWSWVGLLAEFASPAFIGFDDIFATHRAIVVSDRRVLIVRMPWLRAWSIEHASALEGVTVDGFAAGSLSAGGFLYTPGAITLSFSGAGTSTFWFGVKGQDLQILQAEAQAVVTALSAATMSVDISER